MQEYKKSYKGFVVWLVLFCLSLVGIIFLPHDVHDNTQLSLAICDNLMTIWCFLLTFIIYCTDSVYWYNGTSFEEAKQAGSERRKKFAFAHMKRFGLFAAGFLVYSIVSIFIGIPYGIDIAVAVIGIITTAISTCSIKL